jgi:hypothetical protein
MRYIAPLALIFFFAASSAAQKTDPNKFALIINGAGGEPEYAKQFAQWTTDLTSVLSRRYGFDAAKIKVLSDKLANAEEVKRTFGSLKTELDANNVLFVFLIGHGSFDGKRRSSISLDQTFRRQITTSYFRRCPRAGSSYSTCRARAASS